MALDAVKNFVIVTVSTGYDASDTSIALSTGDGGKLPQPSTDGNFNLVWWNDTDYPNVADDPNKEIVRCTARSGDTITITRGQEGTSAGNKNTSSKIYKMALTITQKMIDDIAAYIEPEHNTDGTHKQSAFNVNKNGVDQTGIVNETFTKITWPTKEWDTNNNFANDKFTPTIQGKYCLIGCIGWASIIDLTGIRIAIYKNGGMYKEILNATRGPSFQNQLLIVIVDANGTTDYFEVYVYQNSGSDETVSGSLQETFFQGYKIS